jgi:muramoyltetrapeptide carboxypeptidase
MPKKHIYIYSPSGAVRDKAAFRRGVRNLVAAGYEVEIDFDALSSHTRFAGDDDVRLAAIHRAAASGADLALISRGGYGLTRILDRIRYKAVAKSIERGTSFLGLSDFTAFQLALLKTTGAMSWTGPALCEGFGPQTGVDDIMMDCFNDFMSSQGEGTGWRQHKSAAKENETLDWGCANAVLWGGNLSLVCSLLGTPYFPDLRGGVLFLEDVAEHPYKIERMLTQLLQSGVLARQKAIVLGQFTDFQLTSHDRGFKLASVIDWLRRQLHIPVLTNLPFGHVQTKVLLPVGARVQLRVEGRDALLFWGHMD